MGRGHQAGSAAIESFIEGLRSLSGLIFGGLDLADWRGLIRFVHIAAFLGWAGPAMGASWFVYVAGWERRKRPEDGELLRRERWVRRQFNLVVALEHLAFATLVVTGLMLMESVDWAYAGQSWLGWKLLLVFVIFIPMELLDVILSAWFGRAMKPDPEAADSDASTYARAARVQDLFLRATIPPVMIGIPVALYLAVVKPA
ncbi:MAG: hypothetical protein OEV20_09325 [Actinomycetota bacterium]|nr:hypothetical protein [Actinomycetota bacterium]